jgi:Ca2+-binding RTX toxin-like protein
VETLVLLSGSGSGWWWDMAPTSYDYALATHDANVAAGAVLVVSANGLEAGEDLSFDGSAETDGAFTIYAGFGKETLTGGQLSDGFFFGEGRFSAGDIVSGGGGGDDQMGIRGNYTIDFNAAGFTGVTGIETLVLISANDPRYLSPAGVTEFDYALILADSMAAAGGQLTVTGVGLGSAETMNVDGSAEASASLRLIGGASADTLTGGGGNDLIFGGLGADMLRGNGGADRFVYTDVAQSRSAGGIDRIVGFQSGVDKIDLSAIDGDPTIEGIQALDFRTMFEPGGAGTLRVMAGHDPSQAGNYYTVSADLDGDNIADFTIHVWSTGQLTQSDFIGVS